MEQELVLEYVSRQGQLAQNVSSDDRILISDSIIIILWADEPFYYC